MEKEFPLIADVLAWMDSMNQFGDPVSISVDCKELRRLWEGAAALEKSLDEANARFIRAQVDWQDRMRIALEENARLRGTAVLKEEV